MIRIPIYFLLSFLKQLIRVSGIIVAIPFGILSDYEVYVVIPEKGVVSTFNYVVRNSLPVTSKVASKFFICYNLYIDRFYVR